ncbi:MAG: hypothetical protein ACOCWQ_05595 [Nanoarchaeota archaeon]
MDPIPAGNWLTYFLCQILISSLLLGAILLRRRGQTSIEMLSIISIILIIIAVSLALYTDFFQLGSMGKERMMRNKLMSQEVGINSYWLTDNGLELELGNNYRQAVQITRIDVGNTTLSENLPLVLYPDQKKTLESTAISAAAPEKEFVYDVKVYYTILKTDEQRETASGMKLIGRSARAPIRDKGILSNVSASPFYIDGAAYHECGTIPDGGTCSHTFNIIPNGADGKYTFFAVVNSTDGARIETVARTLTIE